MADPNVTQTTANESWREEYTWWEVAYWLIGIVMIPLVPILMLAFLTPFSGMGGYGH